jgi:2-keto-4-pentenoate hydratase/2-oxohepta-3-ene-1,7-dioic acid hydratase in catechol pathway
MRQSPGLDYSNLRLRTWVNGDLRRDSSTRELSISPNKLLSYVSQNITLLPGDVIFTGTPGKTQAVTHRDTIEIEIEVLADSAISWPSDSTAMSGEFL